MGGSWLCKNASAFATWSPQESTSVSFRKIFFSTGFQQQSSQIIARDKIHNEIIARPIGKEIGNFWQVGMIKTRENSCLAQKLFAGLISDIFREGVVILDLFQRALAALETDVIGEINGPHSALTNPLADLIATAQHLPVLEGWEQCFSFWLD